MDQKQHAINFSDAVSILDIVSHMDRNRPEVNHVYTYLSSVVDRYTGAVEEPVFEQVLQDVRNREYKRNIVEMLMKVDDEQFLYLIYRLVFLHEKREEN